ncbi:S-layer homology domain-containing protein [Candidatus Peregrinibacteria bacterium]|nr:S-layer homology domain-containing protein [Candidatus Peregrinibacteria bacterium]
MKKLTYLVAGALFTLSTTAFAATMLFTDQSGFIGSWFENAAVSMKQKGVINGYPDGSFGPSNQVNRAELAVMLDSYDNYIKGVIDSKIGSGNTGTTGNAITLSQIDDIIDNTLKFADQQYSWYLNFVVLAESNLMKLDGPPQYYGSSEWDEQTSANLPTGYKLYTALLAESGNPSYLHFQGEVCEGDVCGIDKDQWYGPFYTE